MSIDNFSHKVKQQLIFSKLKGKPLTILILFLIVGGVLNYAVVEEWTDYTRPTIRKALKLLVSMGYVDQASESDFRLTAVGQQLTMSFADPEKFFQHNSSSNLIINDLSIKESLTTTTIRDENKFQPDEDCMLYLKRLGVWERERVGICEILNNDYYMIKNYFHSDDVRLAIWKIKNGVEPNNIYWVICEECSVYPCECEDE